MQSFTVPILNIAPCPVCGPHRCRTLTGSPAPDWMETLKPFFTSSATDSGVLATRFSPSATSRGTPIRTSLKGFPSSTATSPGFAEKRRGLAWRRLVAQRDRCSRSISESRGRSLAALQDLLLPSCCLLKMTRSHPSLPSTTLHNWTAVPRCNCTCRCSLPWCVVRAPGGGRPCQCYHLVSPGVAAAASRPH